MNKPRYWFFLILFTLVLAGCSSSNKYPSKQPSYEHTTLSPQAKVYMPSIKKSSRRYGVDEKLVTALIQVESSFNPNAISRSNAIGLMQIKRETAGREVFRVYKNNSGMPTKNYLLNPVNNIDTGTAYLSILRDRQLAGIRNPKSMRYAMMAAYSNGAGALLRSFHPDKKKALQKINRMSPEQVYRYINTQHNDQQARRYIYKLNSVYNAI
ncbi:transglycosylase SLT domain-containing protein [Plesiomonas sp.]|uniref:transglycosylase SLT domain-containing protein n=1 Tax=Plesiomonas sp. TaxID=2486279 RepID=UPI003F2F844A